jgi:hypothetical protein
MLSTSQKQWIILIIIVLLVLSLGCGRSKPTPSSPPRPSGTSTRTPTPIPSSTPAPIPTRTHTPTPENIQPQPSTTGEADAPAIVEITDLILGVYGRGYNHYAMGTTAGRGSPEPYFFIDPNACGMKLEVRTMPAHALPGESLLDSLQVVFQQQYVEQSAASVTWTVTQEPFELELNGAPAARMEAQRQRNDSISIYQITVVRDQERAAIVQGQISQKCNENPTSRAYLDELTNAVTLQNPAPVCYVGFKPDSDPAEYGVGCDDTITGADGQKFLKESGYTQIELGPVTWDECADFMRAHNQERW